MGDTKKARNEVQKATKAILQSKGRQIAENGRDMDVGSIDPATGFWADRGKWAKPGRWLLIFDRTSTSLVASLPLHEHAKRIAGSINAAREIHMGLSTRIVAAMKDGTQYRLYDDFEWLLLFVFPDLPVNVGKNDATSGDTASFDPVSGTLFMKERYPQPYITAQLFKVATNPAPYQDQAASKTITYDEATQAIVDFINIAPMQVDSGDISPPDLASSPAVAPVQSSLLDPDGS